METREHVCPNGLYLVKQEEKMLEEKENQLFLLSVSRVHAFFVSVLNVFSVGCVYS